jgi:V8-like Glu-specific endopeptidase
MWKYTELAYMLAGLYRRVDDAINLLQQAYGDASRFIAINESVSAVVRWSLILRDLEEAENISVLLTAVQAQHPSLDYVTHMLHGKDGKYHSAMKIAEIELIEPMDRVEKEKLTLGHSTLQPISFLQQGLAMARAVALVKTPEGPGSGFLVNQNYFITNNHVLYDKFIAKDSEIWFNYQGSINKEEGINIVKFYPDPDAAQGFFTDEKNDWTIVKLKGDANKDFGALPLREITVKKGDYVNIIQHPGGMEKQIALYHNTVVGVNTKLVQYLTDTQPGSSGSPVFNSKWEVVALHREGIEITDKATGLVEVRNQGTHINLLITQLEACGIKL